MLRQFINQQSDEDCLSNENTITLLHRNNEAPSENSSSPSQNYQPKYNVKGHKTTSSLRLFAKPDQASSIIIENVYVNEVTKYYPLDEDQLPAVHAKTNKALNKIKKRDQSERIHINEYKPHNEILFEEEFDSASFEQRLALTLALASELMIAANLCQNIKAKAKVLLSFARYIMAELNQPALYPHANALLEHAKKLALKETESELNELMHIKKNLNLLIQKNGNILVDITNNQNNRKRKAEENISEKNEVEIKDESISQIKLNDSSIFSKRARSDNADEQLLVAIEQGHVDEIKKIVGGCERWAYKPVANKVNRDTYLMHALRFNNNTAQVVAALLSSQSFNIKLLKQILDGSNYSGETILGIAKNPHNFAALKDGITGAAIMGNKNWQSVIEWLDGLASDHNQVSARHVAMK
ncbi:MAG TPA: hypothetical protein VHA13_04150 [Gammaproteobacteria bacterium]|nr:hypothetical protein [Gammaproteobacteria bacterium]